MVSFVCMSVLNRYGRQPLWALCSLCFRKLSNGHYPLEDVYTCDFLGEPLGLTVTWELLYSINRWHLLWSFISSKQIKLPHSWHSFILECSNCWAKHSGLASLPSWWHKALQKRWQLFISVKNVSKDTCSVQDT